MCSHAWMWTEIDMDREWSDGDIGLYQNHYLIPMQCSTLMFVLKWSPADCSGLDQSPVTANWCSSHLLLLDWK